MSDHHKEKEEYQSVMTMFIVIEKCIHIYSHFLLKRLASKNYAIY
jgi:hypothetical protein